VTDSKGGADSTAGETVEVHDSEGYGNVGVVGEIDATEMGHTHITERETKPGASVEEEDGDGYPCEDCGEVFESEQARGGHKPHCDDRGGLSVNMSVGELREIVVSVGEETGEALLRRVIEDGGGDGE